MRVLIFGASGMLGHRLCLEWRHTLDVWAVYHKPISVYQRYALLHPDHQFGGIDVLNFQAVKSVVQQVKPQVLVNAVGQIKQKIHHTSRAELIAVNALFPHRLAEICQLSGCRLIQLSTDCVFSGKRGMYREADVPDAQDDYGMTKLLGEVQADHALTLRTSMIGWELENCFSLLEWFAAQHGNHIQGYRRAIFSGFTTQALADLMARIIIERPDLHGLYHLASDPINKYELLQEVQLRLGWQDIHMHPNDEFFMDRSLDGSLLNREMRWQIPTWPSMLDRLCETWAWYQQYR